MNTIELSSEIVTAIVNFINEKRNEKNIKTKFPNTLLRNDILSLLDEYCTVIYYPLENESNNGFHITGILDRHGNEKHFVYINTQQTIEKQVFTAAHELGHIWNVDDYISKQCGISLNDKLSEVIINRFAAELLMPETQFIIAFYREYEKHPKEDGKISIINVLKIIAELINFFFVPYKSVVYRMYELHGINSETFALLCGEREYNEKQINEWIKELMEERGYRQFIYPNPNAWINDLPELLDKAERQQSVSSNKIDNLRDIFNITRTPSVTNILKETIDVTIKKEDN